MATALLDGGMLPGATDRAARDRLGQGALTELVPRIGTYAQVSITLNTFDVPSGGVQPVTTLYVTYPGDAATPFDRDYYVREHLPLVRASWGPYGLKSCAAFWPADIDNGTIAICECCFRDEAAMRAALASPETPHVMADVPRFTDAQPAQGMVHPV